MPGAAEFPAHGFIFSCARELELSFIDHTGRSFHGIIGAIDSQRMNRIGAGDAEMNRSSRRNQDAMRDEQILLRNHAHGDGAIRILLGA